MKKILFMMVVAFICTTTVFAQEETAVKNSKIFDNVFMSLNGGASWSLQNPTFIEMKNVNPIGQFTLGKYFTPVVGNQLFFEAGAKEESGAKTFFEHIAFGSDMLFNLNNMLAGYNGKPRVVETVFLIGAGAFRTCGGAVIPSTGNVWAGLARTGLQFNFNLGKARAWQFNIVPTWTLLIHNNMKNVKESYLAVQAGFTYKFKNHYGSHNFVTGKLLNEDEWKRLNDDVNSLRSQNEKLANTVDIQAQTIKELTEKLNKLGNGKTLELSNVINFGLDSSNVEDLQLGNLSKVADALKANKDVKVTVRGYADANTGTSEYNQELSVKRANAVKDLLVKKFGVEESQISTEGLGSSVQLFNNNDWNRVAVFVTK